jgi:hypothetical protein
MLSSGHDSVTRARTARRAGSTPALGRLRGRSRASTVTPSTRAAERALSSALSPGTDTNVPLDCSPAMASATRSTSAVVSIR